jgi:hypothetical protein
MGQVSVTTAKEQQQRAQKNTRFWNLREEVTRGMKISVCTKYIGYLIACIMLLYYYLLCKCIIFASYFLQYIFSIYWTVES